MNTDQKPGLGVVEEILETHCEAWPSGVPLPAGATPHAARVVLNVAGNGEYGYKGYASGFMRSLCDTVIRADRVNRGKLHAGFPEVVDAVDLYERVGLEATQALAEMDDQPGP